MVRLGYSNCVACHLAPQGGGPLNPYGKSVDEAQSLRAGEYKPADGDRSGAPSWGGRITQDVRVVLHDQWRRRTGQAGENIFRPRLMYRNVSELGARVRLAATVTGETASAPRPSVTYDPATSAASLFVNTALVHVRASSHLEITAGRDQLPTGLNIPDLTVFSKARNRLGFYDTPTQVKMHWWGARYNVSPFAYGPGGNEADRERERGGGSVAEFDVVGNQRTIVGMMLLRGTAANGDRHSLGGYTRLGFGRWGVLAEHTRTVRTRAAQTGLAFRQDTTYGQTFWAAREWLVVSAVGERLKVESPFAEHVTAAKLELAARLTSRISISGGGRLERDMATGRLTKSVSVQAALKTVN